MRFFTIFTAIALVRYIFTDYTFNLHLTSSSYNITTSLTELVLGNVLSLSAVLYCRVVCSAAVAQQVSNPRFAPATAAAIDVTSYSSILIGLI